MVELTRFARKETEGRLLEWANGVSCGRIRHEGDLAVRHSQEELQEIDRSRRCSWWYFEEGRRFGFRRATVIVHARVSAYPQARREYEGGIEIERGGVIGPETAGRLLCDARVQAVIQDEKGDPARIGRISRDPPPHELVHRHAAFPPDKLQPALSAAAF